MSWSGDEPWERFTAATEVATPAARVAFVYPVGRQARSPHDEPSVVKTWLGRITELERFGYVTGCRTYERRSWWTMDFIEQIDPSTVAGLVPIAESDLFAIYAVGGQTYLLVQRHKGTPWMALRLSGDGLFRVASLLGDAMRHLYRDVSARLSPNYPTEAQVARIIGGPNDLIHDRKK